MADLVSLWSNLTADGEYNDKIVHETENVLIMKYNGQRSGKCDRHVGVGNIQFIKETNGGPWKFKGRAIQCTLNGAEPQNHKGQLKNVNIFELVIAKEPEVSFRTKEDAYRHFGWRWNGGWEPQSGIIKHTLL